MVSVLPKELEYKVEKLKYKKVEGTSSWKINRPGSVHSKF